MPILGKRQRYLYCPKCGVTLQQHDTIRQLDRIVSEIEDEEITPLGAINALMGNAEEYLEDLKKHANHGLVLNNDKGVQVWPIDMETPEEEELNENLKVVYTGLNIHIHT